MKTFFDKLGKLGEILAPVTGTQNPFFLAIQNHNNVDVQSLLLNSPDTDMARANENGYSSIHCACRYNNMFAIDLIMSRGVAVDFPDLQGNSPLHYAAKHAHLELCRILVDRGAFAGAKNDHGMSAYDMASSHTVRQYLLPLQFRRAGGQYIGGAGLCNGCDDIHCKSPGHMIRSSNYLMPSQSPQLTVYHSEQQMLDQQRMQQQQLINQQIQQQQYQQQQQLLLQQVQMQQQQYQQNGPPLPQRQQQQQIQQQQQQQQIMQNQQYNIPHPIYTQVQPESEISRNMSYSPPMARSYSSDSYNRVTDGMSAPIVSTSSSVHSNVQSPVDAMNITPAVSTYSTYTPPTPATPYHTGPMVPNHNPPVFTAAPTQPFRSSNLVRSSPNLTPTLTPHTQPHTPHTPAQFSPLTPHTPQTLYGTSTSPLMGAAATAVMGPSTFGPPPSAMPQSGPPMGMPPSVMTAHNAYKPSVNASSTNRIIQPDGFHTSASDPELQRKYGHTRNVIAIAPPPIFGNNMGIPPPQYGMYSQQQYVQPDYNMAPPHVYGRYATNDQKHK